MNHKSISRAYSPKFLVSIALGIVIVIGILATLYNVVNPATLTYLSPQYTFKYPSRYTVALEPQTNSILVGGFLTITTPAMAVSGGVDIPEEFVSGDDPQYDKRQIGNTTFYFNRLPDATKGAVYTSDPDVTPIKSDLIHAVEPKTSLTVSYPKNRQKDAERILATLVVSSANSTTYQNHMERGL